MPKPLNLIDQNFGRLTVLKSSYSNDGRRSWVCSCVCGNVANVVTNKLTSGHTTSCGCKVFDGSSRRVHGMKGTQIYSIWKDMRKRCNNPNMKQYADYGGRGISVCPRWGDFSAFYKDMGEPPSPNHTIDRINNDGDYSPDNCRWATRQDQNRNRRNNRNIYYNGKEHCLSEWEEITGIPQGTISRRLLLGWPPHKALTTPVRG